MQGMWGEDVTCDYYEQLGWTILERNVRPVLWDKRLEIDVIAQSPDKMMVAFIEVKTHAHVDEFSHPMAHIDSEKRAAVYRAAQAWLKYHQWQGKYRFDVIQVFGECWRTKEPQIMCKANVRFDQ